MYGTTRFGISATPRPEDKIALRAGDVWTWIAIDADSRLGISYLVGKQDANDAYRMTQNLSSRIANRFQLTTDGYHVLSQCGREHIRF
jgi:transposase-like protein